MTHDAPPSDTRGREKAGTAYENAVRRMGRRDHTERELTDALRADGYPEDEVAATMGRLVREGFVNDARLAEAFVRRGIETRRLGRERLQRDLETRGVRGGDAERGLARALEDASEAIAIDALIQRYSAAGSYDAPERRTRRLVALLGRRGFPAALVSERLRQLWPDAADAWDLSDH